MSAAKLFDLTGQVALVTGASSGLGVRFAQVLAEAGAAVALVARRADRLEAVRAVIEKAGGRAVAIAADVTDRGAMRSAFDAAEQAFGTVTVLVNNAGVVTSARAVEVGEEEWRRVIGTNLDAVFFAAQEAARRMLAAGKGGAVVNIASMLGLSVAKGVAPYAVAKAGVIQLTKAMALELAFKGIRVNAIAPGFFESEMTDQYPDGYLDAMMIRVPAGRGGDPAELTAALLFLASDASSYVTGVTLPVDGGMLTT
jgi:3-oxoacyl-[acyl-carrier protein] reductase